MHQNQQGKIFWKVQLSKTERTVNTNKKFLMLYTNSDNMG
jgi:hypothetical protein